MSLRNLSMCAAALLAVSSAPNFALADDIIVQTAPPAIVTEPIPAPRTGYVWAPGYQRWSNGHYEWAPGHWVEAREHSHWVPDTWEKVDEGRWQYRSGHWVTE